MFGSSCEQRRLSELPTHSPEQVRRLSRSKERVSKDRRLIGYCGRQAIALMIATQRPINLAALNEPLTAAAWTSKPSWQIRPLLDPVIPQDEFKFEADRAHSHVTELNSSHAIPITYPDVVVDVIEQAARATTK